MDRQRLLDALHAAYVRYRKPLAVAGAAVAIAQITWWFNLGAWVPHDTANIWLAGRHLLEGKPVYSGSVTGFLVFVYSPPIAVLAAPWSLLPVEVLVVVLLAGQLLSLRWLAGSWTTAGLLAWLPWVPRELVTGNVDLIMAAAIYAGVRGLRWSGYATGVFTFVKFSPVLATRRWREFVVASAVLVLITVPWLFLWPEWVHVMATSLNTSFEVVPIVWRAPFVLVLLVVRRPWARAMAAALATPAFYPGHSAVLLLAGARLLISPPDRDRRQDEGRSTEPSGSS